MSKFYRISDTGIWIRHIPNNLHVRLNVNLSKKKGIKHHSYKEHNEISKIAKFGCEML
jgi:hypothetical protein